MNPFPQHKFITESFFQEILQKQYSNDSIQVEKLKLEAALAKGENFSSDIIRVEVEFRLNDNAVKKSANYILKVGHSNDSTQELLDEFDVFHREIVAYRDILPAVDRLLLSVGDNTKLAPKYVW